MLPRAPEILKGQSSISIRGLIAYCDAASLLDASMIYLFLMRADIERWFAEVPPQPPQVTKELIDILSGAQRRLSHVRGEV